MSSRASTADNEDPTMRPKQASDINNTERPTAPWKMRSISPNVFGLGDLEGHEFRIGRGVPDKVNEFFRNKKGVKYEELPEWILQYEIKDAKKMREKEAEDMRTKIKMEKDTNKAWLVAEMRRRIALKKEEEEKVKEEIKEVNVRE
jgi:hypothetical protein